MDAAEDRRDGRPRDGFDGVVGRQRDGLYRLAWLLTGDRSWAEELVADAFVAAYPVWSRGAVRDERAYLRQALTNGFRSGVRRRVRERESVWRWAAGSAPAVADDVADTVVRLTSVHRAVLALSPRQRAAVVLYYFEDLSERDVAALLSLSTGAVKAHLSRARAHLRAALGEANGGDHA